MLGAVSGALLLDLAKRGGYMEQLCIPTAPMYFLDIKYFTDITISWKRVDEQGRSMGTTYSIDHPAFTVVRESLAKQGYIEMNTQWSNGDVVKQPFYLNYKLFEEGEQFPCAGALRYTMTRWMNSDEYARRERVRDE